MTRSELEHRLEVFRTEQLVDRIEISEGVGTDFQVGLTLKPNAPLSERFILRLEAILGQESASFSFFRVRTNVVILRFTVRRSSDGGSETDRIEELPSHYACAGQRVARRATIREMITA